MINPKKLGNHQLSIYYEKIERELDDIQKEILEQIKDVINSTPNMDHSTYNNPKKFKETCSPYRETISNENKKKFIEILQQQEELKKEISIRQKKLLKEI